MNLKNFRGKRVGVTLQDDKHHIGTLCYCDLDDFYSIKCDHYNFVGFTQTGTNAFNKKFSIIHIEEIPMNCTTSEIKEEIAKTQQQLRNLQEKLEIVEKQERFNSKFFTPIGDDREYQECLQFLKTKNISHIAGCFDWTATLQGHKHWQDIALGKRQYADSDIQQIKNWVINYLIQKA